MKLEIASNKAIRYSCLNYHYLRSIPATIIIAYSVFNDNNEFCGIISYSLGANRNLSKPYGLGQGEALELTRVALNGKQGITSKPLSISLKLIKKDIPYVKLIISFSDLDQGHQGKIYQATNWYYTGDSLGDIYIIDNKKTHKRSIAQKYGSNDIDKLKNSGLNIEKIKSKGKHRYLYPLNNEMKILCEKLKKPYPKSIINIDSDVTSNQMEKEVQVLP